MFEQPGPEGKCFDLFSSSLILSENKSISIWRSWVWNLGLKVLNEGLPEKKKKPPSEI